MATNAIKFFNNSDTSLIAAHSSSVCLWTFDVDKRNIYKEKFNLGNLKREFTCITLNEDDSLAYTGTRTGDVVFFDMKNKRYNYASQMKLKNGIKCLSYIGKTQNTDLG